jgi:hypothetical protein
LSPSISPSISPSVSPSLSPSISPSVEVPWDYEQLFNSLSDGNLNGQDSWSNDGGSTLSVTSSSDTYEGSKCLESAVLDSEEEYVFYSRSVSDFTSGTFYTSIKRNSDDYLVRIAGNNLISGIGFSVYLQSDGKIYAFDVDADDYLDTGLTYSFGEWVVVGINFVTSGTRQYRVNVNNGSWSSYFSLTGLDYVDNFTIGATSINPTAGKFYIDSISTSYIAPSPSESPSKSPSLSPSLSPSVSPSLSPSVSPSQSVSPSVSPSPSPGWNLYTKGNYGTLPVNNADLENTYTSEEVTNVSTSNDVRVSQSAIEEFAIHQFKDYVGDVSSLVMIWEGQTNLSPTDSAVYLQIYNITTDTWETVDSDNTSSVGIDFMLTGNISNTSNYIESGVVTCRVYQEGL